MPLVIKEFARRQESELYKGTITIAQCFILDFLSKEKVSRMKDLALFMKVSTPAMTGIVDRLVKCGYVIRESDTGDRRIIKVRISTKGMELVKRITQQRRKLIIDTFGEISPSEREDYLRILKRIYNVLVEKKEA